MNDQVRWSPFLALGLAVAFVLFAGAVARSATPAPTTEPPAPVSLADALAGYAKRCQTLSQGGVYYFTFRGDYPEAHEPLPMIHRSCRLAAQGEKMRLEIGFLRSQTTGMDNEPVKRYSAWDGRRETSYEEHTPETDPASRYVGGISPNKGVSLMVGYWQEPLHEELTNARLPFLDILRTGKCQLLGQKTIGAYDAVGIRVTGWPGGGNDVFELWLAPDHQYAPVRMRHYLGWLLPKNAKRSMFEEGAPGVVMSDVTLALIDGRWLVQHARVTVGDDVVKPNIPQPGPYQVTVQLLNYSSHLPPDTSFVLKFPVGTGAWDDFSQTGFIAGKLVWEKQPDGSSAVVPIRKYPELDAMTDYAKGLTEAEWQTTKWARALSRALLSPATQPVVRAAADVADVPAMAKPLPPRAGDAGTIPWAWYACGGIVLVALGAAAVYALTRRKPGAGQ